MSNFGSIEIDNCLKDLSVDILNPNGVLSADQSFDEELYCHACGDSRITLAIQRIGSTTLENGQIIPDLVVRCDRKDCPFNTASTIRSESDIVMLRPRVSP